jgi:hypothetical protein
VQQRPVGGCGSPGSLALLRILVQRAGRLDERIVVEQSLAEAGVLPELVQQAPEPGPGLVSEDEVTDGEPVDLLEVGVDSRPVVVEGDYEPEDFPSSSSSSSETPSSRGAGVTSRP